jgi:hypothetical protein
MQKRGAVGHFGTTFSRQLPVLQNTEELAAAKGSPYQDNLPVLLYSVRHTGAPRQTFLRRGGSSVSNRKREQIVRSICAT